MVEQYPALLVLAPFLGAIFSGIVGFRYDRLSLPVVVMALIIAVFASFATLLHVAEHGEIIYLLGNWPRPLGIEYRIDSLNALVVSMIVLVALITAIYSKDFVRRENPGKEAQYYVLFLLLITGLVGMTITGDAFNLYVLLEVSSLTSYGLIAMGSRRAVVASYNYVIMGTIGASFYLLGVGYLYIKTGSLNMVDIQRVLAADDLYRSGTVHIAFMLIMLGAAIKMAFFPLHGWLPNAYSFAPTVSGCILAPLISKVTVYIMVRMMITVFGPYYVFEILNWDQVLTWFAVLAIVAGSILALAQTDLRKMLAYIIVAEVGYMVGGIWLANENGLTGAIYHILGDAFMTLCVFLAVGNLIARTGKYHIYDMDGVFRKMPWTMAAFTVGALSLIGIPPTCGFFSKWYLIAGGFEAGHWGFIVALLFSSLINTVLFFRLFEVGYFRSIPEHGEDSPELFAKGVSDHPGPARREAPFSSLAALWVSASILLFLGLYNLSVISLITDFLHSNGIVGDFH